MDEQTGAKRGVTVKALKRALKSAGLKTTGKKATLTRRAKKARLMGGQLTVAAKEVAKIPEKVIGVATETATGVGEAAKETTKGVRKAIVGSRRR